MTLQQLKYAIGLAQYTSFNEAASRLFISQPSLSAAIAELEGELGIRIFDRTNRGIRVRPEGIEFLGYARQVVEQFDLLESRWKGELRPRPLFSVSSQHYAFAVNAFVDTIRLLNVDGYECTFRETRTAEIIEDVKNLKSEIGILYLNEFNEQVLQKLIREADLRFTPLFTATPHIFVSARHPLAQKHTVHLEDLEPWPCLSFEQGEHNSFHFSEEILSTVSHSKNIRVSDRATLFNLLIGLDGYTISTGVLTSDLNGNAIVSVPLEINDRITVGYITHRSFMASQAACIYIEQLGKYGKESIID
ncbi:MAG: LysR family transcriptional regulator [Spirochaetales bacterium]|nr:LysR family transcriptional regulator [Spirochaetales bacterium]